MPFPSPIKNVPRERVGVVVQTMLLNQAVKSVEAHEQASGKFIVIPHHTSAYSSSSSGIGSFRKSHFPD